jgi:hypothetical protein
MKRTEGRLFEGSPHWCAWIAHLLVQPVLRLDGLKMDACSSFIAAPPSRRGRPPMNLTDEQRTERRRTQWAERYQRVKKQKEEEEATRRDSNTDIQRTLRHSPSHSNTPLAAHQPLDSGSQVSGAVHGLALRQKSDDSKVR